MDEILKSGHSIESLWAVLSCGAVYHALQCGSYFPSVDEMLKIGQSNGNYWAVLSCGTVSAVYYAVQGGSNYMDEILECCHSKEQATEQYFSVALFIMLYKVVLSCKSADEIP